MKKQWAKEVSETISLATSTHHRQQVSRKSIVNIHTAFLTQIQKLTTLHLMMQKKQMTLKNMMKNPTNVIYLYIL